MALSADCVDDRTLLLGAKLFELVVAVWIGTTVAVGDLAADDVDACVLAASALVVVARERVVGKAVEPDVAWTPV